MTQGTFAALKPDNALYARALVDGGDLSSWEQRPDWRQALAAARTSRGKVFDARGRTIARIAMTVVATVQASGSVVSSVKKDKEFRFGSQADLERHLKDLMDQNGLVCALTDLEMQLDGGDDDALRVSLDRIDSNGHYERGNVQLVCKFANA